MLRLHIRAQSKPIRRVDIAMQGLWMALVMLGQLPKQILDGLPYEVRFPEEQTIW